MASDGGGWMLPLAYVCFGIGGVLLVIGFILFFYLICKLRKEKQHKDKFYGSNITSYPKLYTGSANWLKNGGEARNVIDDADSLHLDVDAIYAQPTDVHRVYHQVAGDHELSQTESQMGSDRSRESHTSSSNLNDTTNVFYSSPNKINKRMIDSEVIIEEEDSSVSAPSLPDRNSHHVSDTQESEQFTARALGGVVKAKSFRDDDDDEEEEEDEEDDRLDVIDTQTPHSARTVASMDRDAALAALDEAYAGEEAAVSATTTPRQLSSRELVDSVYHVGIPVSPSHGPGEAHSSVRSQTVYRYSYYTEPTEPLPGEDEIEYDIMRM